MHRLLVAASVVPSSSIFVSLLMEMLSSPETAILTRVKRRNIPEDDILHSLRRENISSYVLKLVEVLFDKQEGRRFNHLFSQVT
jgi:hypothetical protein